MNRKSYQWCLVPQCANTSKSTPEKLFIVVPYITNIRRKWLQLARRSDATKMSTNSPIYFCEDHFDLLIDMENHMEFRLMGSVKKMRMKPGCMPSKFDCQPDRKRRLGITSASRSASVKRERRDIIQEAEKSPKETAVTTSADKTMQESSSHVSGSLHIQEDINQCPSAEKAVQTNIKHTYFRSKGTQTIVSLRNTCTSPSKTSVVSVALSPFKVDKVPRGKPSILGTTRKLFLQGEKIDCDISRSQAFSKTSSPQSSSSLLSLQQIKTSESSSLNEEDAKLQRQYDLKVAAENTVSKIENNPRFYIGLPKECYFLVDLLAKDTNICIEHILICLKKIRLDTKFTELGDDFGISTSYASKVFLNNIPIISRFLSSFIIKSDKKAIKKNLPMAFRHHYNKVHCIIDCFEIEIQKPSKSVHQALSWSEYKKANTVKYLISSTPDGLINYISPGYGGRISDILLVEQCNFLDQLCPGSYVLADRGFKNIEQMLSQRQCHLLRPPSVASGSKLSNQEARKTKEIASLRIHIERVIRRLREFSMLKPHSVINNHLLRVLDECVVIACALINLQDSIVGV